MSLLRRLASIFTAATTLNEVVREPCKYVLYDDGSIALMDNYDTVINNWQPSGASGPLNANRQIEAELLVTTFHLMRDKLIYRLTTWRRQELENGRAKHQVYISLGGRLFEEWLEDVQRGGARGCRPPVTLVTVAETLMICPLPELRELFFFVMFGEWGHKLSP